MGGHLRLERCSRMLPNPHIVHDDFIGDNSGTAVSIGGHVIMIEYGVRIR